MREPNHVFENILTDSLPSVLLGALHPSRLLYAFRDPWTWLLILAGGFGLLWSPQGADPALAFQILAAFSEETAFRALLQNYAEAWWEEKRREKIKKTLSMDYRNMGKQILSEFIDYVEETTEAAFEEFFIKKNKKYI